MESQYNCPKCKVGSFEILKDKEYTGWIKCLLCEHKTPIEFTNLKPVPMRTDSDINPGLLRHNYRK